MKTATNKFEKARKEMDGSNENLEQYRSTAEECEQVKKDHETTVAHLENQMSEFKAKLDACPMFRAWLMMQGTRVSMLPTVIMFNAGRPVGEMAGAFSGEKLEAFIKDCAAKVRG